MNIKDTYRISLLHPSIPMFFKEQQCNIPQDTTNIHNRYTGLNKANHDIALGSLSNFAPKQSR